MGRISSYVGVMLKGALIFAAVAETLTGLALLIAPSLVGWLLLGSDLSGVAVSVGRVAGIALIGLGVACWPGPPLLGMLIYGVGVTLVLAGIGIAGIATGDLLWPAVGLHGILSVLLGRLWLNRIRAPSPAHMSVSSELPHKPR